MYLFVVEVNKSASLVFIKPIKLLFMNHLEKVIELKNRYFIMRHGESKINVESLIISDPKNGIDSYGLTERGKEQVRVSISKSDLDKETLIYTSDFKRARESAEIVKKILGVESFNFSTKLRERYFGRYDKKWSVNYKEIWDNDIKDPANKNKGVESVLEVLDRTTSLIVDLEKKYNGKVILLVSHGDPLQILQTGFAKISPSKHPEKCLETGEIRELELVSL